jgi:hypothetical protein
VHFRKVRKIFLRLLQTDFLKAETRRAAAKPKQNMRSPQGGSYGPKQCPGDAQRRWDLKSEMNGRHDSNDS